MPFSAGREVARAYLYLMTNDLHQAPFGFLEDVYVDESQRGRGLGTTLVKEVPAAAHARGCYKLIATSRTGRLTALHCTPWSSTRWCSTWTG